jgi:hypothetical protein
MAVSVETHDNGDPALRADLLGISRRSPALVRSLDVCREMNWRRSIVLTGLTFGEYLFVIGERKIEALQRLRIRGGFFSPMLPI